MTVLSAGQLIARRYELGRLIAVGGMGEVWEADDTRLGRSVAVKILRPELSSDEEFVQRFRIEARTVASLDHPGIARVHDYGETEDSASGRRTAYLVMELVRGEPLSTLVARGPMSAETTLAIVEQAALALHAAHERGFVHRDVKPGNILVGDDGRVKLTDFGIAKAANAAPVTRSGMVMGTAHYISPEQATGGEAGPTGDVYSLGIVGYECLTGHRPFRADNPIDVAAMQVRDAPPPLPRTVPVQVRQLIEAVLVKDPARRYATGEEFAVAVAAVRRGESAPLPLGLARDGAPAEPPTPEATAAVPTPTVAPAGLASVLTPPAGTASVLTPPVGPASVPTPPVGPASVLTPPTGPESVPTPPVMPTQTPVTGRPAAPAADPPAAPAADPPADPHPHDTEPRPRTPPAPPRVSPVTPLNGTPRSGTWRVLLLVLFVLLTAATVVLGYLVFTRGVGGIGGSPENDVPVRPPTGAVAGSVTGREDVVVGWTAVDAPLVATVAVVGARSADPTGPPALRPARDRPNGRRGPA